MSFVALLRKAERRYSEEYRRALPKDGLSRHRVELLRVIEENPNATQQQLVALVGIDRSTISNMVVDMWRSGFVSRERDDADLRAFSVTITPDGRRAMRRAEKVAQLAEEALLAPLSASARAILLKHLGDVANG